MSGAGAFSENLLAGIFEDPEERTQAMSVVEWLLLYFIRAGCITGSVSARTASISNVASVVNGVSSVCTFDHRKHSGAPEDFGYQRFKSLQEKYKLPASSTVLVTMELEDHESAVFDMNCHFAYIFRDPGLDQLFLPLGFLECNDGKFNVHFVVSSVPCKCVTSEEAVGAGNGDPVVSFLPSADFLTRYKELSTFLKLTADAEERDAIKRVIRALLEMEKCNSVKISVSEIRPGDGTRTIQMEGHTFLELNSLKDVLTNDGVSAIYVSLSTSQTYERMACARFNVTVVIVVPSYSNSIGKKRRVSHEAVPEPSTKAVAPNAFNGAKKVSQSPSSRSLGESSRLVQRPAVESAAPTFPPVSEWLPLKKRKLQ